MKIDFHVHTNASDGLFSPAETVLRAKARGLDGLAITDHDTVSGLFEAERSAKQLDMVFIPGLELSCSESESTVHILAFGVDTNNKKLAAFLEKYREGKKNRLYDILSNLNKLNMPLTFKDIEIPSLDNVNRVHVARAMVKKGYVEAPDEAFSKYLAKGKPAYVGYIKPTVSEGIEFINSINALPVLAHPGLIKLPKEKLLELISTWKHKGLAGIEAFHPAHSLSENEFWNIIAKKNNMLVSGGSDFHDFPNTSKKHSDLGHMLNLWVNSKQDTDTLLQFINEGAFA
ncbi:MAG: PHP domain-containing protein [Eubacteriales bacterium]|nr:PHP domain-containing protein [Eubacteriales bacterium]